MEFVAFRVEESTPSVSYRIHNGQIALTSLKLKGALPLPLHLLLRREYRPSVEMANENTRVSASNHARNMLLCCRGLPEILERVSFPVK
jgi:hypothetical protein